MFLPLSKELHSLVLIFLLNHSIERSILNKTLEIIVHNMLKISDFPGSRRRGWWHKSQEQEESPWEVDNNGCSFKEEIS